VIWPGRFEVLRSQPPVIVDSAHNRDSAMRLRQAIDDYLPGWPVVLLYGASEDKDIEGMFEALMPRVDQVIATQSIHPRAAKPSDLAALAEKHGRPAQALVPLEDALEVALAQAGGTAAVIATGSLFVVGAVRDAWAKRSKETGAAEELREA
jgi:dihydrofolate synthase/folylpolyglutamate synthase